MRKLPVYHSRGQDQILDHFTRFFFVKDSDIGFLGETSLFLCQFHRFSVIICYLQLVKLGGHEGAVSRDCVPVLK